MDDAEYVFRQEIKDRKNKGFGAHGYSPRKRGGVRLPSDNLTKKELEKLNSDVSTIRLYEPMNWPTFRKLERDLQKEYIQWLREEFDFRTTLSKKLFGVCDETLRKYLFEIGMNIGPGQKKRDPDKANAFNEWLRKNNWEDGKRRKMITTLLENYKAQKDSEENYIPQEKLKPQPDVVVKSGSFTVDSTVDGLKDLLVKLTGNKRMIFSVSWYDPDGI